MKLHFYFGIDSMKYKDVEKYGYILVTGWCYSKFHLPVTYKTKINGENVDYDLVQVNRPDVFGAMKDKENQPESNLIGFRLTVKTNNIHVNDFELIVEDKKGEESLLILRDKVLKKICDTHIIENSVDNFTLDKETKMGTVQGWVYSLDSEEVNIIITDDQNKQIEYSKQVQSRPDLVDYHMVNEENKYVGYHLMFPIEEKRKYFITFNTEKDSVEKEIKTVVPSRFRLVKSYIRNLSVRNISKAILYLKKNGVKKFIGRLSKGPNTIVNEYENWFLSQRVSPSELEQQRNTKFKFNPKISILVATFNTKEEYLKEMVDTVVEQSYSNWELCIADGSTSDSVEVYVKEHYSKYGDKIKFRKLDQNYGISGNTNKAFEIATGDYLAVYDHDDTLELDCLYEFVKNLQDFKYDVLYTDEDKFDDKFKCYCDPNFKPDYSEDLLRSHNYITHFFCVSRKIVDEVGYYNPEYDGSQDYDYIFRCVEKANAIYHVHRVLYHWRMHPESTAMDPESKMYCYTAGKRAIEAHYKRCGVNATVEMMPKPFYGCYHTTYSTEPNPLVSILIPNYNNKTILKTCVDSLYKINTYKNFEIVIVENNSTEYEIFDYYKELENEHDNVKVVTYKGEFNYSKINNFGMKYTKGDYVLLLNNDTEVMESDSLSEMLGCCMRPEVGAVGAKLLYEDNTIQHAGVVVGFNGYAGHVFNGIGQHDYGYMLRPLLNCNYSAVTAACMMVKKSVFEKVGGFDEQFEVAGNDVDLCLKIRQANYLIVYNAFALWHHYESKSRGYENTPEKLARFDSEVKKFQEKWPEILENGDPFYNKNWDIKHGPFML